MLGRVSGALDEGAALEDVAYRVLAYPELSGGDGDGQAHLVDRFPDVVVAVAGSEAADGAAFPAAAPAGFQGAVMAAAVPVRPALRRAGLGADAGVAAGWTGQHVVHPASPVAGLAAFFTDAQGGAEGFQRVGVGRVAITVEVVLVAELPVLLEQVLAPGGRDRGAQQ